MSRLIKTRTLPKGILPQLANPPMAARPQSLAPFQHHLIHDQSLFPKNPLLQTLLCRQDLARVQKLLASSPTTTSNALLRDPHYQRHRAARTTCCVKYSEQHLAPGTRKASYTLSAIHRTHRQATRSARQHAASCTESRSTKNAATSPRTSSTSPQPTFFAPRAPGKAHQAGPGTRAQAAGVCCKGAGRRPSRMVRRQPRNGAGHRTAVGALHAARDAVQLDGQPEYRVELCVGAAIAASPLPRYTALVASVSTRALGGYPCAAYLRRVVECVLGICQHATKSYPQLRSKDLCMCVHVFLADCRGAVWSVHAVSVPDARSARGVYPCPGMCICDGSGESAAA